jgi:Holliday junction resolvase-like predicted endonuclease
MKSHSEKLDFEKIWKLFQETDKKFRETAKQFEETKQLLKEESLKTEKKLRQLENLFIGHWGKLVESLVEGNLAKILRERGIDVRGTRQRVKSLFNGKEIEIDILAINGTDVVAVEVKTTLKVEDVNEFIEKLKVFKKKHSQNIKTKISMVLLLT